MHINQQYQNIIQKTPYYDNISNKDQKSMYKGYLLGQNPPNNLLGIDSNKSVWSDISYIYKVFYDNKFNKDNKFDKDKPSFPDTFCIKVDSPSVIPAANKIDCRSIKTTASPIITASGFNFSNFGSNTGTIVVIVIAVLLSLLFLGFIMFIVIRERKRK